VCGVVSDTVLGRRFEGLDAAKTTKTETANVYGVAISKQVQEEEKFRLWKGCMFVNFGLLCLFKFDLLMTKVGLRGWTCVERK
jgi:hypothetical protein